MGTYIIDKKRGDGWTKLREESGATIMVNKNTGCYGVRYPNSEKTIHVCDTLDAAMENIKAMQKSYGTHILYYSVDSSDPLYRSRRFVELKQVTVQFLYNEWYHPNGNKANRLLLHPTDKDLSAVADLQSRYEDLCRQIDALTQEMKAVLNGIPRIKHPDELEADEEEDGD
jgi:hypothetical protein